MTTSNPFLAAPAASVLEISRRRIGSTGTLALLVAALGLLAVALAQLLVSLTGGDRLLATLCALAGTLPPVLLFGGLALERLQGPAKLPDAATAPHDALTGQVARGAFVRGLEREWTLARRHGTELSIVLIDIDHIQRVNDHYGKRCGDELLRRVGTCCSRVLRGGDVLARFGGEEFIVMLPHTDPLGALDLADRLRMRVAALDFDWLGHSVPVQVSLGVVSLRDDHALLDQLLHEADRALQKAKSDGRNCVRALGGPESEKASRVR